MRRQITCRVVGLLLFLAGAWRLVAQQPSAREPTPSLRTDFPAGLIELGTIDLPTHGRFVTAPDRVQFGADLMAAMGKTFPADRPAAAEQEPIAPGKFIPTFAVKYAGAQGWPPLEDAARFDLLDVSAGEAHAKVFATKEGNTWQRLKRLNPHLVVVQYELGPGEYNTASWGGLGDGWQWITKNHGIGTADRWTASGARYGEYLEAVPYRNERLMVIGNPNWQRYWLEAVEAKLWTKAGTAGAGVDGLFADNTRYAMIWQGRWLREGHRDQPDVPADYYRDGKHLPELWKAGTKEFLALAVPWLAERGRKLVLNYGDIVKQPEDWADLDSQPNPVFAAMEEGAFVHPWGRPDCFIFRPEKDWLLQVRTMRSLKQVRALMNVHGNVRSQAQDLTRMDAADADGNRAWDVLWYALTSFLQGYDDVRQNAYMNFTVWSYNRFYWFKEFDPRYLHLGKARGQMRRVEGERGHVYLREFDRGWVVTNPTSADARQVPVPAGKARILTHDTFEQAEAQPLVARFDLASRRGVLLLKEGHRCGQR
jgi:hypothetical protein